MSKLSLANLFKAVDPRVSSFDLCQLEQRCGGDDGVRRRTTAVMSPADGEEKGSRRRLQLTAKKKVRRLHLQLRAKKKGDIWRRLFLRAKLRSGVVVLLAYVLAAPLIQKLEL
nr:hypothetical protein Iba_chr04eCG12520 [Ipomoea batatas]